MHKVFTTSFYKDGKPYTIVATVNDNYDCLHFWINGEYIFYPINLQDKYQEPTYALKGASLVITPLPGSITKILVRAGQVVKKGQVVAILSSMKIEHHLLAEIDGVVDRIFVVEGSQVSHGEPIVAIKNRVF